MRRLKWQLNQFRRHSDQSSILLYSFGDNSHLDQQLLHVIKLWLDQKGYNKPLLEQFTVKKIQACEVDVALIIRNNVVQGVIIYQIVNKVLLIDQEYYNPEIPGVLEFGIIELMEQINKTVGIDTFSFGLTLGVSFDKWATPIEMLTKECSEMSHIMTYSYKKGYFNGDGNFQFKQKFRPVVSNYYIAHKPADKRQITKWFLTCLKSGDVYQ